MTLNVKNCALVAVLLAACALSASTGSANADKQGFGKRSCLRVQRLIFTNAQVDATLAAWVRQRNRISVSPCVPPVDQVPTARLLSRPVLPTLAPPHSHYFEGYPSVGKLFFRVDN